jgi:glucose/arabinose dehydrogenase
MFLHAASGGAALAADSIDFQLPDGFAVEVLVDGLANARSLALGSDGTLFVGTRRAGKLYAVKNVFSGEPEVITIAEKLQMPNGVAFRDGALYVAEIERILRFPDIENRLEDPGAPEVVDAALPVRGKLHAWKYIGFGPDDKLYVSLGAPCNACSDPDLSIILRMNADGSSREVFARGVRNSLGFAWHPVTEQFWFTDNGRDMMGDDIPAGELNRADAVGLDFGFPYCHGTAIADPDPEISKLGRCEDATAPAQELGPHVAPLGMAFYTGNMFPEEYRNQILIAEHGSWNRSKEAGKTGYRVTLVRLEDNRPVSYEPFMQGFLEGDNVLGRPVDVLVAPDGAVLVSDDKRGVIYRISYASG